MMSERFVLSSAWLNRKGDAPFDRAFAASINISVDGIPLTRLFSELDNAIRDDMRGCAWQLAEWFAANWWRLRWESDAMRTRRNDVDWGMSHCMACVGGGFVWPAIIFESDGESIGIFLSPNKNPPLYEPVRYLNEVHANIPAEEFERSVDAFLTAVIVRGTLKKDAHDGALKALWDEVLNERNDTDASRQRKWEAIAGYDPDGAPDQFLEWIDNASVRYGQSASEEVIAQARHESAEMFQAIQQMPKRSGVIVTMPKLTETARTVRKDVDSHLPWQRGEYLARRARKEWGVPDGPLTDKTLAGILDAPSTLLTSKTTQTAPLPFALHEAKGNKYRLYLQKKHSTSRRFAACRLFGDSLQEGSDRLHPATDTDTARQKFQRSFAAEFLCPFDALEDKLGKTYSRDSIEDAAVHFNVSPLTIGTILVNKDKLDRDTLGRMVG
jgi:hypothetical protein